MAGVEAIPQSKAVLPDFTIPLIIPFFKTGPVILESIPTAILSLSALRFFFSHNHFTKDKEIIEAISGERFIFSSSDSTAMPRISDPF